MPHIVVTLKAYKEDGQYQTAGLIFKEIGGQRKEHHFIRADRFQSLEEAADFSLHKGRQLVEGGHHVTERAEEAVAPPDHQEIEATTAGIPQEAIEFRPAVTRARDVFVGVAAGELPPAAFYEVGYLVLLELGPLVGTRDAVIGGGADDLHDRPTSLMALDQTASSKGYADPMPLAATALSLLTAHRSADDEYAKHVLHVVLNTLIRHAPRQHLYVSRAAQVEARRRGLGDLAAYDWYDQVKKMGDKGRKVFAWDHFFPVAELRRQLDALEAPTERSVRKILRRSSIAWILKVEDRRLNELGFRQTRPDPHAAYAKAGIRLIT